MQIFSSATGRKPNIVSVYGKPLNVNENEGIENSEIVSTEASNGNQMIFVKGFRDAFSPFELLKFHYVSHLFK
jgi:hypothetical protein